MFIPNLSCTVTACFVLHLSQQQDNLPLTLTLWGLANGKDASRLVAPTPSHEKVRNYGLPGENGNDNWSLPPSRGIADTQTVAQGGSTRRTVIAVGATLSTVLPVMDTAWAAAPVTPSEAIRRSAANIPGYGQTDVFYPPLFLGIWRAKRSIVLPGTDTASNNINDVITLEYPVRFVPSIQDDAVVADRGWNQANLEMALRQFSAQKQSSKSLVEDANTESSLIQMPSYQWTETNPNDLRLTFPDGSRKEIKVTKRATEKTDDTVFSSEFQRITQEDARGIPIITARRVVTKYKVVGSTTIEGLEIVYEMGGGGDPMAGPSRTAEPQVLSKSRIRLERLP